MLTSGKAFGNKLFKTFELPHKMKIDSWQILVVIVVINIKITIIKKIN